MAGNKRGATTEAVRQFCAANGTVRKAQLREALGLTANQVDHAIDNLKRSNTLAMVETGLYRYVEARKSAAQSPVSDRIWRYMRMTPKFTPSEIERVAGTTASYFYKLARGWVAAGYLAPAGRRKGLKGYAEKVWRLTLKGKACIEQPEVEPFRVDPLVAKTVALNRIICTGLAAAVDTERKQAMTLCGEIMDALSEIGRQSEKNAGEPADGGR